MVERAGTRAWPDESDNSVGFWASLSQALSLGVAFLAAELLGRWLAIGPSHIPTFCLAAGLLVGVLLRVAPRRWPPFVVAAALARTAFDMTLSGYSLPEALGISVVDAVEAVAGAALLRQYWFRGRPASCATLGDVLAIAIVAGLAAPLVGAAVVAATGLGATYFESWPVRWSIRVVGILLVTPMMLAAPPIGELRRSWREMSFARRFETLAIPLSVTGWTAFCFIAFPPELRVTTLVLPILLWPALRSSQLSTAVAVVTMALVATRLTALGHGRFALPYHGEETTVLLLQSFLGVVAVSTHILAAVTGERRSAIARLACFNSELEVQVASHTAELRASEERARNSLDELRAIYDGAPVGLCALDRNLRFVRVNERLAQMHGIPAAEHIGRTVREVLPDIADAIEPIYRRILATGEPLLGMEFEGGCRSQPGKRYAWLINRLPLLDSRGEVVGINVVFEDITERKASEARLRRLNETLEQRVAERTAELEVISAERSRLASVAENSPDFIGICDLAMRVVYVNPAGRRLIGIENDAELKRRTVPDYFVPEERAQLEHEVFAAVLNEGHWLGELTFQHFGTGEPIPVLYGVFRIDDPTTGKPSHYATVTRDLRERRQAEERLRQAQKMEAVGQLTGGVAHDFNNLLTAVLGNIELAENKIADAAVAKLLGSARRAAERGAELTTQLLAFARKQRLQPKTMNVNALVDGMGDLLLRTIGGTVRIERRLTAHCWSALVDPNQIELTILNLAINARDAMPLGGTLTIETRNIAADDREAPQSLPSADYVMISVADTGIGIREDVLPRVFEPFFTTKGMGKGSGLGLSMVLGIAQQHGGGVEITSRVGSGTTVRLYLPRVAVAEQKQTAVVDAPTPHRNQAPASRVLVVDDDPDMREVAVECLRELGHRAIDADTGQAALDVVASGESIDLALVDLAMPGMSGAVFAAAARQYRPALRILFMTGYADADTGLLPDAPDAPILKKPFGVRELAVRIGDALAEGQGEKGSKTPPVSAAECSCSSGGPASLFPRHPAAAVMPRASGDI